MVSRSGRISRGLIVAVLAASCTVAPTATPRSIPASASPTDAPTGAPASTETPIPSAAPAFGANWERATGIDGAPEAVAHGPGGWVAVGTTCPDECGGVGAAASWFSADGLNWSSGTVPGGANTILTAVATDGSTWFAAGVVFVDPTLSAPIWRSPDGLTWSLLETFSLGQCIEGCPSVGRLAAGPGGVILSLHATKPERRGVLWSADGVAWTRVDNAMLGAVGTAYWPEIPLTVVRDRFVMIGAPCDQCFTVRSSPDGREWTLDAKISLPAAADPEVTPDFDPEVATDGDRIVVVDGVCPGPCRTSVWTSPNGRTDWVLGSETLPIWSPRVAYAAGMFIAVGMEAPNSVGVFTSTDGRDWTRVAANLGLGDCDFDFGALAGAADRIAVTVGPHCSGIWVSRAPTT